MFVFQSGGSEVMRGFSVLLKYTTTLFLGCFVFSFHSGRWWGKQGELPSVCQVFIP